MSEDPLSFSPGREGIPHIHLLFERGLGAQLCYCLRGQAEHGLLQAAAISGNHRVGLERTFKGHLIRLNLKLPRPSARPTDLDQLTQLLSWAKVPPVRLPLVPRALHFDFSCGVVEVFSHAALIVCVPANTF